jgi:hypothetical protein
MKTVIAAAVALLLGLFLGGLGPRADLRRTQKELAEAKEAAARAGSSAALPLALGMGSLAAARNRAQAVPRFTITDGGAGSGAGDDDERPGEDPEARRARRRAAFGDGGAFAAAKSAADVRAAQFRAAFLEEARLPPDRQQAVDASITKMNEAFAKAADEIAETIRAKGEKVRPRDMADIGAKLLDIYRQADDSFRGALDDNGRRAADRTQFDVLTQVDIGAFRKLAETMESVGVSEPLAPR